MVKFSLKKLASLLALISVSIFLKPTHNANRYFPFLEKTPTYPKYKRLASFEASAFVSSSTRAWGWGDDKVIGIYDLTNRYDLKNVINSLKDYTEKIEMGTFKNPFLDDFVGSDKFVDKSIKYDIAGKARAEGGIFNFEQYLPWKGLSLGIWFPIMRVSSHQNFILNENDSALGFPLQDGEKIEVDRVRRNVHAQMGFTGPDYVETGVGDLDLYFRLGGSWPYTHFMHSINFSLKSGLIIPTSNTREANQPASIPFMGDGHGGVYVDVMPELEFRENWKFGLMLGFLHQFDKQKDTRMPSGDEPMIFSALRGKMRVEPGLLFKFSPYLDISNLADGLNLQLRWTYLRHEHDDLYDVRPEWEKAKLASNLFPQESFTEWRANYLTFQVAYDSYEAMKKWPLNPKFFAVFDFPFNWIGGKYVPKSTQFTIGAEFNF
ncbi:TPA: hypothetical protein DEO28_02460 [Candidatus Dependentiae bacterium]|nr:MAG: hypothetical protein UR14_C0008G0018 [candidate division TM6 bacterium GW2011_GWE2_31_21]KKP53256.1 MAG: hypothetical protein UR43_C0006G0039 [candidate division TM6 bacterium GW2011_GWF2_33_332]HBS48045.1 hypothetical protein [Candidatus Dependentiae bacterium]HBZ73352.1 hypothetical protein [Candidatus Dependentiae bacterium]